MKTALCIILRNENTVPATNVSKSLGEFKSIMQDNALPRMDLQCFRKHFAIGIIKLSTVRG